jgi:hypothetical protein
MRLSLCLPFLLALAACQASTPEPPQPAPVAPPPPPRAGSARLDRTVVIIPPDPKVPKRYAAFSGRWKGNWDGASFDALLAVRSIAPNGAVEASYAWGTHGDIRPGTAEGKGRIRGDQLKFDRFANGGDAVFVMQPDGTLAGSYSIGDLRFTAIFVRQ